MNASSSRKAECEPQTADSKLRLDLARGIIEDLQWSDLPAGAHLTEQRIASLFGVSRSPVRGALRRLADHDVLRYEPNRGYFLTVPGRELTSDLLETLMSPEDVLYRRLVRDRLSGELPDEVRTADLERRYRCPRSLVRRLLRRMAQEGLVEQRPGHGWAFRSALTSAETYDAAYRFRLIVEPAALLEPTFAADPERFEAIRAMHERVLSDDAHAASYSQFYEVDRAFHEAIGAWSGNQYLLDAIRRQNRLRRLTEYEYYADRTRMHEFCREHVTILAAVGEGDLQGASRLMRRHIEASWHLRPVFPERRKQPLPDTTLPEAEVAVGGRCR